VIAILHFLNVPYLSREDFEHGLNRAVGQRLLFQRSLPLRLGARNSGLGTRVPGLGARGSGLGIRDALKGVPYRARRVK